jgi:hypothetical protein
MSWDIFVHDLPSGISLVDEIPSDFLPAPIGLRSEIIAKVKAIYPEGNFSDPSWGRLELPDCSVEFNLGGSEQLKSFAPHIRGGNVACAADSYALSRNRAGPGLYAQGLARVCSAKHDERITMHRFAEPFAIDLATTGVRKRT